MTAARDLHARLTKPAGSLGYLEDLSVRLAGLAGTCPPPIPQPAAVAVFAGDHGVHAQGVTPWPQEVTAQMVANFLAGGAVVNAFARQVGATVTVVDIAVASALEPAFVDRHLGRTSKAAHIVDRHLGRTSKAAHTSLVSAKVRAGTGDITTGPALTRAEARQAVETGIEVAE